MADTGKKATRDHGERPQPLPGPKPGAPTSGGKDPRGRAKEIGGRGGPDPTRFGDWEIGGRCVDF